MTNNNWEGMFKAGQQTMDAWMKMFSPKKSEGSSDSNFGYQSFGDFLNFQKQWFDMWRQWMENTNQNAAMFQGPYEAWTNLMSQYNPTEAGKIMSSNARDVFEKMMNSNKLYLGLYDQWERYNNEIIKPGTENYQKNWEELFDKFNESFMNNFIPLLPEEMKSFFVNPHDYFVTYMGTMKNFMGPWQSAYQEIADILLEASFKDPTKISEALKAWKDAYSKTFGTLAESPVVGSSRETVEQVNHAVNAMVDMMVSFAEYLSKCGSVAYENSRKAFEEYFDSLEKGDAPKTFNEFYKHWSKVVEDAIEKYFYTDEFSQLIAKTADSAMVFKIESDKVIEKMLANTPIVTTSEVDNVYKNVYNLKREVRELKKEIKNLKKELEKNPDVKKASDTANK